VITVKPAEIAREFCLVIREWLSKEQMLLVVERNDAESSKASVCHTHDFCDANMAMDAAFKHLGVDPLPDDSGMTKAVVDLWNEAWSLAKAAKFDAAAFEPKRKGFSAVAREIAAYKADIYKAKRNARAAKKGGLR